MVFDKQRLKTVMKINGIYDSDILSQCGYKRSSGILDHPDQLQLKSMREYFDKKYPVVNFDYIIQKSNSINKYIDTKYMNDRMIQKSIGINQFNTYIESVLNEKNAYYRISNGLFPKDQNEADQIIHYIDEMIDHNGDYTYINSRSATTTSATTTNKDKTDKTEKKVNGNARYIRDPDNYRENKLDLKLVVSLCNKYGYRMSGFTNMVCPNNPSWTVSLFSGKMLSVPLTMLSAIQAALNCDTYYLEGKRVSPNNCKHYFPRDESKTCRFLSSFIDKTDKAIFKVMANNAGIGYNIMQMVKHGEAIYFTESCIRSMFTKDLLIALKIKDLNDIIYTSDGKEISNRLVKRSNKCIAAPKSAGSTKVSKVEETKTVLETKDVEKVTEDEPKQLTIANIIKDKEAVVETIENTIKEKKEAASETKQEVKEDQENMNNKNTKETTLEDVVTFLSSCSNEKLDIISKICDNVKVKNNLMKEVENLK